MKKLVITIPTYNEFNYLKVNLSTLIPQINKHKKNVDLYLFDNNSTDETGIEVPLLFKNHSNCFYIKNEKNIGLYQNQLKCLKVDNYMYKMVVGSDDIILPDSIDTILSYIDKGDFALLFSNYYSFIDDYMNPHQFFAEQKDIVFPRAYDLLNHPSVGHFSGFIFRNEYVNKYLDILLKEYEDSFFEKHRGIIAFLAAYTCSQENKNTFFIGKRCIATKMYKKVDYNHLTHLCVEYLNGHYTLYKKGIANDNDFLYRKRLIKKVLLRSSIRNLPFMTINENYDVYKELKFHFKNDIYYNVIITPIFYILRINLIRKITALFVNYYIDLKN
tara:strand:+ start:1027 stop:2016 length:990 start_codon:yes stop_codon:yes gene_type:complete